MSNIRDKIKITDNEQGFENLCYYIEESKTGDGVDFYEGLDAYFKYNLIMKRIAEKYGFDLELVVAAFCALSPNNDYVGNVRSLISCLDAINKGIDEDDVIISTYNHCKKRAWNYLLKREEFVTKDRGLKILNFYFSILHPNHPDFCTIDGHMVAAYNGMSDLKMVEATINRSEYQKIKWVTEEVAGNFRLLPSQAQAIIWFCRKQLYKIKFSPFVDMFGAADDKWGILLNLDDLKPFSRKSEK